MDDFPDFIKRPANRIATSSQATPGVEGYAFDGTDGSQMAFWTCRETAISVPHVHDYDEYMIVVQGCYTLLIEGQRIPVRTGEEYFIPKDSGTVVNHSLALAPFTPSGADAPTGLGNCMPHLSQCPINDLSGVTR
jgi:hypothetical protein